ncbi:hypothetical protein [Arthrobacter sp. Cr_A7]|uniref:hypothetical protein n=1 Tax=Arthrobacter sp. Cr_A7 TaxID=3031017 RepID=UPI0023DC1381|nr:hypothetical protein [Arthrobacter sp. Cr_A7]MDF2049531.1 hypothetical protein [Arthrobacter sp. Cr_A7]
MKKIRFAAITASLCMLPTLLTGCIFDPVKDAVDVATAEIEESITAVERESGAWRNELPQLTEALTSAAQDALAQGKADVEQVLTGTTNSVRSLAEDTIKLSGLTAEQLVASFGAEVRCNLDFARTRVSATLRQLSDSLKFWKENDKKLPPPPAHSVCQLTPSSVEASASGEGQWAMTFPANRIIGIYGYDFTSTALPGVELRNASDVMVRESRVSVAYVTRYQINLDFSGETFEQIAEGYKFVLRWPDNPEPNALSITLIRPSDIKITAVNFPNNNPRARVDVVAPTVEITNMGGQPSGDLVVTWKPGPEDPIRSQQITPVRAGEKRLVAMPTYTYPHAGRFAFTVNAGGLNSWNGELNVTPYANLPSEAFIDLSGEWPGGGGDRGKTMAFPRPAAQVQLEKDCELDTSRGGGSFEVEDIDHPERKYTISFPAGYNFDFREGTFWRSLQSVYASFDPTGSTPHAEAQVTLKGLGGHGIFASRGPERFNARFTVFTLCPSK